MLLYLLTDAASGQFTQPLALIFNHTFPAVTNPCLEMSCSADSYCVARADGTGAECVCSPGFEKVLGSL